MGAFPPALVVDLVEHFEHDREALLSADYKEKQLRPESGSCPIIRHSYFVIRTCLSEPVIHEESIKACPEPGRRVAGATKAPADGLRPTAHSLRLPDSDSPRSLVGCETLQPLCLIRVREETILSQQTRGET